MNRNLSAFLCGVVFATGLAISQMTRPPFILGFLNVAGDWNPTLLILMISAGVTYFVAYHWVIGRPIKEAYEMKIAKGEKIDLRTVVGAVIFGIGWGLIGLCPGPAMTDLMSGKVEVFIFVIAMFAGMFTVKYFDSKVKE